MTKILARDNSHLLWLVLAFTYSSSYCQLSRDDRWKKTAATALVTDSSLEWSTKCTGWSHLICHAKCRGNSMKSRSVDLSTYVNRQGVTLSDAHCNIIVVTFYTSIEIKIRRGSDLISREVFFSKFQLFSFLFKKVNKLMKSYYRISLDPFIQDTDCLIVLIWLS